MASDLASCTSRVLGYPQRHRWLACEVAKSALRGLAQRRIRQNGVKLTGTHAPSNPSRDVVRALPSPVKCVPVAWRGGRLQSTELAALPLCSGGWTILTFRRWCSCLPGRAEWTPWAQDLSTRAPARTPASRSDLRAPPDGVRVCEVASAVVRTVRIVSQDVDVPRSRRERGQVSRAGAPIGCQASPGSAARRSVPAEEAANLAQSTVPSGYISTSTVWECDEARRMLAGSPGDTKALRRSSPTVRQEPRPRARDIPLSRSFFILPEVRRRARAAASSRGPSAKRRQGKQSVARNEPRSESKQARQAVVVVQSRDAARGTTRLGRFDQCHNRRPLCATRTKWFLGRSGGSRCAFFEFFAVYQRSVSMRVF
ncbi:hypothetical protein VTO73DRAFT_12306 [Trametes versicolor]